MRVGGAYVVLAVLCAHASATSTAGLRGGAEEHQAVTRRLFGGMLGALLGKPGDEHSNTLLGALGLGSAGGSHANDDDDFSNNLFAEEHIIRENDSQAQKWAA